VCTAVTRVKSTHVYIRLQHTGSVEEQEQQQQLEGLLESAARMLPAAQQGLATAPHQTDGGPALALTTTTAAGQVSASCLNPVKLASVAAAHLSSGCSFQSQNVCFKFRNVHSTVDIGTVNMCFYIGDMF